MPMRGPILLSFLGSAVVGLVLVGATPAARAAPATGVAVTSVTTHGVDAAAVPGFAKSLLGGLAAGGLQVTGLQKTRITLKTHAGLAGCETAVCLKRIGTLLQVPLCGKATVEMSGTTTFRIEVVLTASMTGKQIVRLEKRCELCTLKEAREALSQAAADAAKKASAVPGLEAPRKVRQRPVERRRVVKPPPKKPRFRMVDMGRGYRRWGLVTAGAGLAALIPGIVLLAMDGNVKGSDCDGRRCVWDTKAGGATLLAIGAAAVAAGAGLFIYGLLKKRTKVPVKIMVGVDPRGGLHVWGRF